MEFVLNPKIVKWWLAIAIVLLTACVATTPVKQQLTINALVIENHSSSDLHDVKIKVEQTGAFASCGLVLRGRSCSTTFKSKIYQGNPVFISWTYDGKQQKVGPLYGNEPDKIKTGMDAAVVIAFNSARDVTVQFRY